MRISGGLQESGVIVGNTFNKYGSHNIIVRFLMHGFESIIDNLVQEINPSTIHEVGCGEGFLTLNWLEKGISAIGTDFSTQIINIAKTNAKERSLPEANFIIADIYTLDPALHQAELVVCAEVLEHLNNPEKALSALRQITKKYLILSVPNEPVWSVLNMARGKYWSDFGNTPGHIQRWSKNEFIKLVSKRFIVERVFTPLPWTILLCK